MVARKSRTQQVIVIAGPTASGKSAVAMRLAQQMPAEIICADSRTIYQGMDIGTAKPSRLDRQLTPHWGLDLVKPGQRFTAHDFKEYSNKLLPEIASRHNIPIIVGGSGLYIDAVAYNFSFRPGYDPDKRSELENKSIEELTQMISQASLIMPANYKNKRHLIRTIEAEGASIKKSALRDGFHIFGIMPRDELIKAAIKKRIDAMYTKGFLDEVKSLAETYGDDFGGVGGIGYGSALRHIRGQISEDQAKQEFSSGDWQYARRQKTWFKRNKDIEWFHSPEQAFDKIQLFMAKHQ